MFFDLFVFFLVFFVVWVLVEVLVVIFLDFFGKIDKWRDNFIFKYRRVLNCWKFVENWLKFKKFIMLVILEIFFGEIIIDLFIDEWLCCK